MLSTSGVYPGFRYVVFSCCYRGWGRVGAGRVGARGGGKVRLGVVFGEMWGIGYWGWGSGIEVLGRGYWDWYWDWYWG